MVTKDELDTAIAKALRPVIDRLVASDLRIRRLEFEMARVKEAIAHLQPAIRELEINRVRLDDAVFGHRRQGLNP